jgi:hypothetical protein
MDYVPIKWPSWRYGPNGQAEIFQSEDQVPEGWADHPSKVGAEPAVPLQDDDDDDDGALTAEAVAAAFSQDQLIAMIVEENEGREEADEIEYLGNWSKIKLAQALIDAEVEIEMPEAEEE